MLLSRVERNKIYRKNKRRFRLFIVVIIIFTFIALIQINNTYNELLDITEANQIFAIKKEKDTMAITIVGRQLEISNDYIILGKEFIKNIYRQIYYEVNKILIK